MATDSRVEYMKGYKSAAAIELPYESAVVEEALKGYFLKNGIKEDKVKGFQAFRGARLTPTDGEVADLYFKVERKSRKESNISVVYMIVGRPNENVSLRTVEDNYRVGEGKSFLNEIVPSIEAHDLEVSIKEQDEVVKKAERKLRNLEDDQKNLERKIRNMEEQLAQNKRDQESQVAEVAKQRSAKQAMEARRAPVTPAP